MANTPTNLNDPTEADPIAPRSRDPMIDTTLDGRFHIEEVLGTGGMSVVYKARQLRVNRHVAIKTIRMQLDSKPVYKERFQREISSLCALNHPNIVTVYDCVIGPDDQPYVVMDYLRGRSLEALVKAEGPLGLDRYGSISMQICSALEHAHKKGIVHRDLKPSNIVLMDDETDFVKVVDFGLAKLSEDNRKLTHSGELWGSPPYMSPEQCMGESGDERSDIYSLGAVMYEMVTGHDPFWDATTVFELIQRHVHATPAPLFQANPNVNVPMQLEMVIFKALEKNPLDRFQSAQELQASIVEACKGDSGNLIFHPSRSGKSNSGGYELKSPSGAHIVDAPRSEKSQQIAWFDGMLNVPSDPHGAGSGSGLISEKTGDQSIYADPGLRSGRTGSVTPDLSGVRSGAYSAGFRQNDSIDVKAFESRHQDETVQNSQSFLAQSNARAQSDTFSRAPADVSNLRVRNVENPMNTLVPIVVVVGIVIGLVCAIFCMPQMFGGDKHPQATQQVVSPESSSSQPETRASPATATEDEDDKKVERKGTKGGVGAPVRRSVSKPRVKPAPVRPKAQAKPSQKQAKPNADVWNDLLQKKDK